MQVFENDGDCYESAGRRVAFSASDDMTLVHGVVTGQGRIEGIKYGHAWVERTDPEYGVWIAEDRSNGRNIEMPREAYYALARLDRSLIRRYTPSEVRAKIAEFGHWGPWEDGLSPESEGK